MKRRTTLAAIAIAPLLASTANPARAGGPIRIVIGFPVGGGADAVARVLAEKMSQDLGETVIVESKPGAGGQIAAEHVRAAAADGSTILYGSTHIMVMGPITSKTIRYDPLKDFRPLGRFSSSYEGIVVPAAGPATLQEWIAGARNDPARAMYAVPASGSVPEFIGWRIANAAGIRLHPVPYKGAAPMVQDLLGGQVPAGITAIQDLHVHHNAGRLRVLAVNGERRAPNLPDVPTLREAGFANFETLEWGGLFVAAATPPAQVERLEASLAKAMANPDTLARLARIGVVPSYADARATRQLLEDDWALWSGVVKAAGFVPN